MRPSSRTRPRLLAVVTVPPVPVQDGLTLRVAHLLRELGQRWDITLVAPVPPVDQPYPGVIPGVARLETVPLPGRLTYLPWQYDHRALRDRVDALVHELRPPVLLAWSGAEFVAFDRPHHPPVVSDHIDCLALTTWRSVRREGTWRRRLSVLTDALSVARYERRVGREARAVVLVGEDDARAMRRLAPRAAMRVISNGVALPSSAMLDRPESARPTVIFTGTLDYPPNVAGVMHFVSEVLPLLRERVPNVVFRIAGRSPTAPVLGLRTMPGIELSIDVPDMPTVLADAWVAVAPMRSGSGVKNKILEAWAMARPVVMTRMAANGLQLDAAAESLVTDTPEEMARCLAALFGDTPRRRRLGAAGRALVERAHTWTGVADEFDRLLRAAADGVAAG